MLRPSRSKKIFIDISNVHFNRYISNFLRYFHDTNYTIYIPNDKELLEKLWFKKGEFAYTNLILRFSIKVGKPINFKRRYKVVLKNLSNNYYHRLNPEKQEYFVPIGKHPEKYLLKSPTDIELNKKNFIFFIGNVNNMSYNKANFKEVWNMPNRFESFHFARKSQYYCRLNGKQELFNLINTNCKPALILIDDFRLNTIDYFKVLSTIQFFLALPGIIVPECHNLIESMEYGCIPIIHENYARLLNPPLEHKKNSMQYGNLNELNEIFNLVFHIDKNELKLISEEVIDYWSKNFNQKSIVKKIVKGGFEKIHIQAEHFSINV